MSNFHGSDVEKIAGLYQVQPQDLINFGVNANPLGLPAKAKRALAEQIELFSRYPDPEYAQLKNALSRYLAVDFARILPASGTSELIHQVIRHFAPKKALLYTPTYSEYASDVRRQGGQVLELPLVKDNHFQFPAAEFHRLLESADFVLLCNPNNPTATLLSAEELAPLIGRAQEKQIPFIIDETYIEFTEQPQKYSAISLIRQFSNLIILRGFSKFFAAPGLRLGYAVFGNPDWLQSLQSGYPWGVHALAAYAGEVFLEDQDYIQTSHRFVQAEKKRISTFLEALPNLTVYPATANFFLLELQRQNATDLFLYLLHRGLLIRNFHDEIGPGFFRFCILDQASNTRLLEAIADFVKGAES